MTCPGARARGGYRRTFRSTVIENLVSRHGTGMGFRFLALFGLGALVLAVSRPVRAESSTSLSTYDAPETCENADAFRARVTAAARRAPPYHARITAHADRFEGTVLLPGAAHPSRTIEAETCDDVVKALALAVSLSAEPVEDTPAARPFLLMPVGATPPDDRPSSTTAKRSDVLVSFGASMITDSENRSGAALDVKVVYRRELFAAGALAELGGALFEYNYVGVAPMAGIFAPGPKWLRAGLLGAAGVHAYWNADGTGWFGGCPCASGALPFTGLRAIVGVDLWYVHLGLHGFADADLGRRRGTLVDADTSEPSPFTIGTNRFGAGIALGPRVKL